MRPAGRLSGPDIGDRTYPTPVGRGRGQDWTERETGSRGPTPSRADCSAVLGDGRVCDGRTAMMWRWFGGYFHGVLLI